MIPACLAVSPNFVPRGVIILQVALGVVANLAIENSASFELPVMATTCSDDANCTRMYVASLHHYGHGLPVLEYFRYGLPARINMPNARTLVEISCKKVYRS